MYTLCSIIATSAVNHYLIAYTVLLIASHICFYQKNTTLVYVLKVTVIHSLYAQIPSVNRLLSSDAYFDFSDNY